MDLSDATIQAMVNYLQQTMSHDANIRRPAEKYLEAVEVNQNYPLVLLHLIDKTEIELVIRISGAITFKNYIKRNWTDADGIRISQQDRQAIKNTIIDVMLKREDQIQRQLSDAVAIIGKEDFPKKWPQLLSELVARIRTSNANFQIINGILQTLHSLFKRFRHEFKSDELFTTIKYVLDNFSVPFTELFVATTNLAANAQRDNNEQTLKVLFSSLVLCAKVFYSLNAQDLPEEFEDRLDIWMPHFLKLLDTEIRILETDSEDEVGLLQQLKSEICDIISMFAQKYHEEFEKYLPDFVEAVWKLLTTSGQEPKFDNLISNAIKFLSTVANRPQFKSLFEKPGVLDGLCSKVIIPNIELRQCDIELFEDNCEDYIRADIEGSDVDTRRKSACDLVKSLARNFEANIVRVFSEYIKVMLDSFATNPQTFWKNKDAAIYLVTAICVKGSTERFGTTQTTDLVNVVEFYSTFVKSDIDNKDNINNLPVLRADALKYIMTFRNQLPLNEIIIPTLPIIIKHLSSQSVVVHTYAAIAIEKILTMKNQSRNNIITAEHIQPVLEQLITSLFCALQLEGSSENEYIMKAIMRTIATSRNSISPYLNAILSQLNTKLAEVCRNPSKPYFNHYLFESIALSLQIAVNSDPNSAVIVENTIFQMSDGIFTADVQEFLPYIIQLLSLLTEYNNTNQIPDRYLQLLSYVISPILWDKTGNIHPLVRLLKAFIRKSPQQIIDSGRLEAILGIFQKLVASRANDHEGLDLLQCLFNELPIDALKNFVKDVFLILFTRLSNSKTTKYVTMLIVFISFFAYKFGPSSLEDVVESIQPKMFGMLIDKVLITDSQKIEGKPERRIACVGLTRLLCESASLLEGDYSIYWPKLLETIVGIFELPTESEQYQEEFTIDLEDTLSYQASYSKLVFAPVPPYNVLGNEVPEDARLYLASCLNKLSLSRPGVILNRISQNVQPTTLQHLNNYFQSANLTIS